MTPERWSRIKDIFAAVTNLPAEKRAPALIQACEGDTGLQADLERLLSQHDEMGGFLEGSSPASAASLLAPGSLLAGRYQIVALLGSGGMGEVYQAEDKELGGRIALKVIRPQPSIKDATLDRFRREVQLARQVTHPNVCRVFDIGRDLRQGREIVFLTMEFVPGETLAARLRRDGTIAFPEAFVIARQLCLALSAAHEAGVLHRDFKPGNVILAGAGESVRATVTDFGIARLIDKAAGAPDTLTTEGAVFGTPAYMSPEQIQGKELTAASDIYSLGLVLYEMVTGARPFRDESPWSEAIKRLTEDVPEPRKTRTDVAPVWNQVIPRCVERDPMRRYASAQAVAAALQGQQEPSLPRNYRRVVLSAAAVLLVAAASTVGFRGRILAPAWPAEKRIAVLPFRFVGGDPANQATAYGLAESLAQNLSRLPAPGSSTWVVPWSAVRERPAADEGRAGAALGANLLVTGQMERREGRWHVTSEIKSAGTLATLKAAVIDVPENEAVTLENKLLEQTASMLRLDIPPGSLQRLRIRDTPAPGAFEFYEEGRGYLLRRTADDVDQAIYLLKQAIARDPGFALAKANLAIAYEWKYRNTNETRWLDQSREVCAQALALDDKSSPSRLASGLILQDSGDLGGAVVELQQALVVDPSNDDARSSLSAAYDQAGRPLEAESLLKEALNRNPANWTYYNDLAIFYYHHQQYNLAEPLFRSAMELAPGNPKAFYNLGGLYTAQGKYKEAEEVLRRAIAIKPASGAYSNLGTVLRAEGRYAESAAMLEKATDLVPGDGRLWLNLGNAYTLVGDMDKARNAYERSVQELQKALSLRPHDVQLLNNLALNYANLHQKNNALLTLARMTGPPAHTPTTLFGNAIVYELVGDRERSLATLQAAVHAGLSVETIRNTPTFEDLRADPRYARMVAPQAAR